MGARLEAGLLEHAELDAIDESVRDEIESSVIAAKAAPLPEPDDLLADDGGLGDRVVDDRLDGTGEIDGCDVVTHELAHVGSSPTEREGLSTRRVRLGFLTSVTAPALLSALLVPLRSGVVERDRSPRQFIFGDGAGAAIVGASDHVGIGPTIWGSDGAAWEAIRPNVLEDGSPGPTITMQGQSVFRWAVWSMAPVALRAIDAAGLSVDDIDVFIPHQANVRIIDAMAKQMKLPERVVIARDIVDTANTSAASVPLAAERLVREGQAKSGDLALQIGFGAGLAYAAQVVEIP